ncbi:hypothetical protein [Microbacterium sp. RU33B]|uniref:hypothetical protein n=1 Tax=Microbacterium sp. RU33B TaxID=1907390 RepID=UPI00095A5048|nr:hypothetical protein [Microbacterium sp. RU33B]SIT72410.1 hypothetical protein SAMN05880545_1047 [Microbacterium sp. RU33B]
MERRGILTESTGARVRPHFWVDPDHRDRSRLGVGIALVLFRPDTTDDPPTEDMGIVLSVVSQV